MNPAVREYREDEEDKRVKCDFCGTYKLDNLTLGPMYSLGGVTVHYFCLLFSSGLSQNGEDDEGIWGFLPKDIKKEITRGKKLKCRYCKKPCATVGCSVPTCKIGYHYPCGYDKGSLFQFIGNYASFCSSHREPHNITLPREKWHCPCCLDDSGQEPYPIKPPCCNKNSAVYHRICVMRHADKAGMHHVKCPLCSNKDQFSEFIRSNGVYVPDRDAAWELENAFADQTQLYSRCDQLECICPSGRTFNSDDKSRNRDWKIIRCGGCGARGVHMKCANLNNYTYRCETCAKILHGHNFSSDEEEEDDEPSGVSDFNRSRTNRINRTIVSDSSEDEEDSTSSTDLEPENNILLKLPPHRRDSTGQPMVHEGPNSSTSADVEPQNNILLKLPRPNCDSTNQPMVPKGTGTSNCDRADVMCDNRASRAPIVANGIESTAEELPKREKEKVFGKRFRVVGDDDDEGLNTDVTDEEEDDDLDEEPEEFFVPNNLQSSTFDEDVRQRFPGPEMSEVSNIPSDLLNLVATYNLAIPATAQQLLARCDPSALESKKLEEVTKKVLQEVLNVMGIANAKQNPEERSMTIPEESSIHEVHEAPNDSYQTSQAEDVDNNDDMSGVVLTSTFSLAPLCSSSYQNRDENNRDQPPPMIDLTNADRPKTSPPIVIDLTLADQPPTSPPVIDLTFSDDEEPPTTSTAASRDEDVHHVRKKIKR